MSLRLTWLLLLQWIFLSECQLNQHIQYIADNGDYVWESTSDFVPVQSESFGNITIGHVMSMEFDFKWNGRDESDDGDYSMEMFFRIGADGSGGTGCSGNQNRYPALFLSGDDIPFLSLHLSEEGACSTHFELDSMPISEGVWYHVVIAFNQSSLTVSIDSHSETFARGPTANQFLGSVVPVWWMSNKFGSTKYPKANGTFSEITIRSTLILPTDSPTAAPTASPTHSPLPSPSPTPTPIPIPSSPFIVATTSSISETLSIDMTPSLTTSDHGLYEQYTPSLKSSNTTIIVVIAAISVLFLCTISTIAMFYLHQKWNEKVLKSLDRERGLKQIQFSRNHLDEVAVKSPLDDDLEDEAEDKSLDVFYDDGSFEVIGSYDNEVITAGADNAELDAADDEMVSCGLKIWIESSHRRGDREQELSANLGRVRGQTEGKMPTPGRKYTESVRTPSTRTPRTPGGGRGHHAQTQSAGNSGELSLTEDVYAE